MDKITSRCSLADRASIGDGLQDTLKGRFRVDAFAKPSEYPVIGGDFQMMAVDFNLMDGVPQVNGHRHVDCWVFILANEYKTQPVS